MQTAKGKEISKEISKFELKLEWNLLQKLTREKVLITISNV